MKLEEIEKLCNYATQGPWSLCFHLISHENDKSCNCGYRGSIWGGDHEHVICEMGSTVTIGQEGLEAPRYDREQELINAKFIAESRILMPKLLAIAKAAKIVNKFAIEALHNGNYIYGSEILDEALEELEK